MGLIPGYIPNEFLDIISRIPISFGSTDMESAVLGVMYSLIAIVPLFGANHVVGLLGLFKQNKVILLIVSIQFILLHQLLLLFRVYYLCMYWEKVLILTIVCSLSQVCSSFAAAIWCIWYFLGKLHIS